MALFVCAGAAARRALNGDWLPERAFGIDILRPDSCTLVRKAMAHYSISSERVLLKPSFCLSYSTEVRKRFSTWLQVCHFPLCLVKDYLVVFTASSQEVVQDLIGSR